MSVEVLVVIVLDVNCCGCLDLCFLPCLLMFSLFLQIGKYNSVLLSFVPTLTLSHGSRRGGGSSSSQTVTHFASTSSYSHLLTSFRNPSIIAHTFIRRQVKLSHSDIFHSLYLYVILEVEGEFIVTEERRILNCFECSTLDLNALCFCFFVSFIIFGAQYILGDHPVAFSVSHKKNRPRSPSTEMF